MATKKIEIRPKGTGDYADILYPKTSADMVIDEATGIETTSHVKYGGVTTGSANTYAVSLTPAPASYYDGLAISFKINVDATGASTINVNGLGAKGLKKANGTDMTNSKANGVYTYRYNATTGNFIVQGEGGAGNAVASDLLSGKTASTDAGDITGTMPNNGTFNLALGATVPAGYYSGGTVPDGKRYASGTSTSSSTTSSFTYTDGTTNSFPSLSVTGLSYKPTTIIVYDLTNHRISLYSEQNDGYYAKTVKMTMYVASSASSNVHNFKGDVSSASVINGSFTIPVYYPSTSMNWLAIE